MKRILFSALFYPHIVFTGNGQFASKPSRKWILQNFKRKIKTRDIDDVVITGTIKPMSKSKSPVAVEIYSQKFFQKNPTPSIFEAIAMVNGVKPQLNCSVCNTGDIHINWKVLIQ
jgi:outer membrane receptor for ferrienterochelin and colicins